MLIKKLWKRVKPIKLLDLNKKLNNHNMKQISEYILEKNEDQKATQRDMLQLNILKQLVLYVVQKNAQWNLLMLLKRR